MKIARLSHFNSLYRYALVRLTRLTRGVDPMKVVFCCFQGSAYGDNPRCISQRLHERRPDAKPEGIVHVYVNGQAVLENGAYIGGRAGKVLLKR